MEYGEETVRGQRIPAQLLLGCKDISSIQIDIVADNEYSSVIADG
jgi:hypothetical protein